MSGANVPACTRRPSLPKIAAARVSVDQRHPGIYGSAENIAQVEGLLGIRISCAVRGVVTRGEYLIREFFVKAHEDAYVREGVR